MTLYELKDNPGCVVVTFRAVQFMGDPDDIRTTFGDDVQTIFPSTDTKGANVTVVRDNFGNEKFVMYGDFVFERPDEPGHIEVLTPINFLDTYRQSAFQDAE